MCIFHSLSVLVGMNHDQSSNVRVRTGEGPNKQSNQGSTEFYAPIVHTSRHSRQRRGPWLVHRAPSWSEGPVPSDGEDALAGRSLKSPAVVSGHPAGQSAGSENVCMATGAESGRTLGTILWLFPVFPFHPSSTLSRPSRPPSPPCRCRQRPADRSTVGLTCCCVHIGALDGVLGTSVFVSNFSRRRPTHHPRLDLRFSSFSNLVSPE